jgi:hypothetical protein
MDKLEDFTYTAENLPLVGDDVRVRPEPSRPITYGQGDPVPGPKWNGVQFYWSQALVVDATNEYGIGDPAANTVHLNIIAQTPELFMSEANYQSCINQTEE